MATYLEPDEDNLRLQGRFEKKRINDYFLMLCVVFK